MDYILNMAITVVLATIKEAFKNPEKKEMVKKAMLKIRANIDLVYGDPSQELIERKTLALDRLHNSIQSAFNAGIITQAQHSAIITRATISGAHDPLTEE
jgi:hypothetical protein